MARNFFAELCDYYNAGPNARGWVNVECPFCGKEASQRTPAFSFNRNGYHCFSCQATGNRLMPLIQKVGLWSATAGSAPVSTAPRVERHSEPEIKVEAAWKQHAHKLVEGYCNHPRRIEMWQEYKPVSEATINKHRFGVGILPGQTMTRLIVPLFFNGEIVGLKGRALPGADTDVKWIFATGSDDVIWGYHFLPRNPAVIFICENYVDAALLTQITGYHAISCGGARKLKLEEMYAIKALNPGHVVVAYDNDLVGSASPTLRRQLELDWTEAWRARHPEKTQAPKPPRSNAFALEKALTEMEIPASTFSWPDNAPHKADVLWALQQDV